MELNELSKNFAIGITGGIASGKSSASRILTSWGYLCIDADQLAREAVLPGSPGLAAIVKDFTNHPILQADGSLDRKKLGEIVFQDPLQRKKLEAIVHPEIQNLLRKRLTELQYFTRPKIWFYEAALLFEANLAHRFKEIWLIVSDPKTQVSRLRKRDPDLSTAKVQAIMAAQMSNEEKMMRATRVVNNDGDLEQLAKSLREALSHIRE